mmetsp:Transcript_12566/g.28168  ORF Transcript_12566/g.28168 Transcript_12566/m.28168 type:complete len:80 (+) Transcript_12566:584-823(+)
MQRQSDYPGMAFWIRWKESASLIAYDVIYPIKIKLSQPFHTYNLWQNSTGRAWKIEKGLATIIPIIPSTEQPQIMHRKT